MYHVIGDVHGCRAELERLFEKLGYTRLSDHLWQPPDGVRCLFVGDLIDRGPDPLGCLETARVMGEHNWAHSVLGNHEHKLIRWLQDYLDAPTRANLPPRGRFKTVRELVGRPRTEQVEILRFLQSLPLYLSLDEGQLIVVHAAWREDVDAVDDRERVGWLVYGPTTNNNEDGRRKRFPNRVDWTREYHGKALVVWGHQEHSRVYVNNHAVNIDQGCANGGALTAMIYEGRDSYRFEQVRSSYDWRKEMDPQWEWVTYPHPSISTIITVTRR